MITYKTTSIANAASLSGAIDVSEHNVVGIILPATWTTADLSFTVGYKTGTDDTISYFDAYDAAGSELVVEGDTGNRFIAISPLALVGAKLLKVRSGTTAVPVVQAGARTLVLVLEHR